MGFAWVGSVAEPESATAPPKQGWFGAQKAAGPPRMAEDNVLRNEFCEIHFDPHTGAIRSLFDHRHRDPRLAQQIALRLSGPGDPESDARYSIMAADEVCATSAGPILGEMVARAAG